MPLHLRKATLDDVAFATACAEEAYAIYIERIGKRPAPMDQDFTAAVRNGELDIIEQDGVPLGYAVSRQSGSTLFIENIALSPATQGKGLARWLFSTLEQRALAKGCVSMELYTNAKMTENLALYPHLGFEETGRRVENGFHRVYFRKVLR